MTMLPTSTPGSLPTDAAPRPSPNPVAAVTALYRLFLREQLTRGRLLLAGSLGGLSLVIAFFIDRNLDADAVEATINFVFLFGLGLVIPILSLVLASSSLGNLVEDETLVYLWMRPNPRWQPAIASWLASLTVAIPLAALPVVASAAVGTAFDGTAIGATVAATGLAVIAYTGLFTLLGLVSRWALLWGLVYIFIWEGFVSRAGAGAARLSVGTYPSSVLARLTEIDLLQADRSPTASIVVPLAIAAIALALTTWRLTRANVA